MISIPYNVGKTFAHLRIMTNDLLTKVELSVLLFHPNTHATYNISHIPYSIPYCALICLFLLCMHIYIYCNHFEPFEHRPCQCCVSETVVLVPHIWYRSPNSPSASFYRGHYYCFSFIKNNLASKLLAASRKEHEEATTICCGHHYVQQYFVALSIEVECISDSAVHKSLLVLQCQTTAGFVDYFVPGNFCKLQNSSQCFLNHRQSECSLSFTFTGI